MEGLRQVNGISPLLFLCLFFRPNKQPKSNVAAEIFLQGNLFSKKFRCDVTFTGKPLSKQATNQKLRAWEKFLVDVTHPRTSKRGVGEGGRYSLKIRLRALKEE